MTAHGASESKTDRLFEKIGDGLLADATVSKGTGFGSSPGLRVGSKVFAMLIKGELVVKLPKERVDQLVASGTGARFDPGHGRLMKEWLTIPAASSHQWRQLTTEALQFVSSGI